MCLATYTQLRDFLDRYTNDEGTIQGDPATIAAEAVAAGWVERDEEHDRQYEEERRDPLRYTGRDV